MSDVNHNSAVAQDDSVLLHLAVIEENEDVVKFLLKHGVPVNSRAVNKQLSLEFLTDVEHQMHVNSTIRPSESIEDDPAECSIVKTTTALHLACRSESKDMAELLLEHGAEVNSVMEGGETPLMIAVISRRQPIVELLVSQGADVNASTVWGKSALHYAAQTGQKNTLEYLLKHGGHVNATSLEGLTPLHLATEAGHKELVALLLKHAADLNIRSKTGASVLHFAAVMGHKEILEMLIDSGADINVLMKHGYLDLSPFSAWVTESVERKTWGLIARYTTKMNLVNWYNTMVTKFYRRNKEKRSVFHAMAESEQDDKQIMQQ